MVNIFDLIKPADIDVTICFMIGGNKITNLTILKKTLMDHFDQ